MKCLIILSALVIFSTITATHISLEKSYLAPANNTNHTNSTKNATKARVFAEENIFTKGINAVKNLFRGKNATNVTVNATKKARVFSEENIFTKGINAVKGLFSKKNSTNATKPKIFLEVDVKNSTNATKNATKKARVFSEENIFSKGINAVKGLFSKKNATNASLTNVTKPKRVYVEGGNVTAANSTNATKKGFWGGLKDMAKGAYDSVKKAVTGSFLEVSLTNATRNATKNATRANVTKPKRVYVEQGNSTVANVTNATKKGGIWNSIKDAASKAANSIKKAVTGSFLEVSSTNATRNATKNATRANLTKPKRIYVEQGNATVANATNATKKGGLWSSIKDAAGKVASSIKSAVTGKSFLEVSVSNHTKNSTHKKGNSTKKGKKVYAEGIVAAVVAAVKNFTNATSNVTVTKKQKRVYTEGIISAVVAAVKNITNATHVNGTVNVTAKAKPKIFLEESNEPVLNKKFFGLF